MFETKAEFIFAVICFIMGALLILLVTHPPVVEVPVEVIKEVPVEVTKIVEIKGDCPPCQTTIREIIKEPCPEKRCVCTARGGYADNQTGGWWE